MTQATIAGDKKYVDQYRALLEHPRRPARSVEEYRDSIQIHLEAVDKCLDNAENMTLPSDAIAKDLEQLQNGIQALAKEYHTDRIALEKIVLGHRQDATITVDTGKSY